MLPNGLCYNVLGFPATPKPIGKRIVGMVDLGVFLERFLLKITSEGISYSFSNQPCEIPALKENLRQNLNLTTYPSVIIRLGYGNEPKAFAPREDVKF